MKRTPLTREEHERLAGILYGIGEGPLQEAFKLMNGRMNVPMVDKLLAVDRALTRIRQALENQVIDDTGDAESWTIYTGGYQRRKAAG